MYQECYGEGFVTSTPYKCKLQYNSYDLIKSFENNLKETSVKNVQDNLIDNDARSKQSNDLGFSLPPQMEKIDDHHLSRYQENKEISRLSPGSNFKTWTSSIEKARRITKTLSDNNINTIENIESKFQKKIDKSSTPIRPAMTREDLERLRFYYENYRTMSTNSFKELPSYKSGDNQDGDVDNGNGDHVDVDRVEENDEKENLLSDHVALNQDKDKKDDDDDNSRSWSIVKQFRQVDISFLPRIDTLERVQRWIDSGKKTKSSSYCDSHSSVSYISNIEKVNYQKCDLRTMFNNTRKSDQYFNHYRQKNQSESISSIDKRLQLIDKMRKEKESTLMATVAITEDDETITDDFNDSKPEKQTNLSSKHSCNRSERKSGHFFNQYNQNNQSESISSADKCRQRIDKMRKEREAALAKMVIKEQSLSRLRMDERTPDEIIKDFYHSRRINVVDCSNYHEHDVDEVCNGGNDNIDICNQCGYRIDQSCNNRFSDRGVYQHRNRRKSHKIDFVSQLLIENEQLRRSLPICNENDDDGDNRFRFDLLDKLQQKLSKNEQDLEKLLSQTDRLIDERDRAVLSLRYDNDRLRNIIVEQVARQVGLGGRRLTGEDNRLSSVSRFKKVGPTRCGCCHGVVDDGDDQIVYG